MGALGIQHPPRGSAAGKALSRCSVLRKLDCTRALGLQRGASRAAKDWPADPGQQDQIGPCRNRFLHRTLLRKNVARGIASSLPEARQGLPNVARFREALVKGGYWLFRSHETQIVGLQRCVAQCCLVCQLFTYRLMGASCSVASAPIMN